MTINASDIIPIRTASCSVMGDYAIKKKMTVPYAKAKPGDISLYDFNHNGTSDHFGIIVKVANGKLYVVEGNTSDEGTGGSDSNGGMVALRIRTKGDVNYIVRPKHDETVTPEMIVTTALSQVGIKESPAGSNKVKYNTWFYGKPVKGDAYPWCAVFGCWCFAHVQEELKEPTGKYTGKLPAVSLELGKKGTAVVQLQKFLTWYGIKTDDDGDFGGRTKGSVLLFQWREGLELDGVFGKKCLERAKTYLKAGTQDTTTTQTKTETKKETQTTQTSGQKLGECIDASYWQGKISEANWEKIRKTCEFAICRASYTSLGKFTLNKDSTFATNYVNAKVAGLKVGVYHFSQALTVDEAKTEAEYLCRILKDFSTPTFWVVCDYETNAKGRLNGKTVSTKASDIANAFCKAVEEHGYKACIYANLTMLQKYLKKPKYPVWLAQYNDKCTYAGDKVMWQYTSRGRVDGIDAKNTNNGKADVDLSHVYAVPDLKEIIKEPANTSQASQELKGYDGKFPTPNTNAKIVNGMAVRMCWPYGTPEKMYTFKDGKPTEAYKDGIDKVYPKHKDWPNKRQKAGACCDVFVGADLGLVGIKLPKDLKNQLVDMPKMTKQLKSNGHYLAKDFEPGDVVQRGRKDKSGHTWVVCEVLKVDKKTGKITGVKYIANAHYKHLKGCYAVMDAKPANIVKSKWAYYKCYTVLGAVRTYYKEGDYGWDVVYIQKFLNWCKLKDKDGKIIKLTVDGDFGKKTAAAVETYQKWRKLTADRIVGEKTMADMKKVRRSS